jgi:uncharacterized membrane protein
MAYAPPSEYVPQRVTDRPTLLVWIVVAVGAFLVSGTIVAAPLSLASGHDSVALTIYAAFSHFCHQIPERSFFIAGHRFAVCARCFGLYAGFTAATLCYPLVRSLRRTDTPPRGWLFVAAAPLAIDFSLTYFGLWENTHVSRLLTGVLLGAVSVFYVMPGLMELSTKDWRGLFGHKAVASN